MILIKLVNNEEFILDDNYNIDLNGENNIKIDPNNWHRVFYRYTDMSEEYKQQLGIEIAPNRTNKVIEFGFTPINVDPQPFLDVNLNKNNILYIGHIKENSGLYKMFIKYREEMGFTK